MLFVQRISQTVDVVNHNVIVALGRQYVSGLQVKVGERQSDFFPDRHSDVPHALGETFVVVGPVLGLDHPRLLFGKKAAALDI